MNFSELSHQNIKISNELIKSVREAHRRYQNELEKQRKIEQESQKSLKRKLVANEINPLKEKRIKLISEIKILRVDGDLQLLKQKSFMTFIVSQNQTNR